MGATPTTRFPPAGWQNRRVATADPAILTTSTRLRRRAAAAAFFAALTISALKLGAAVLTGSVALVSTLLDSLADLVAVSLTVVAVTVAARPADVEHRYGHGKAEGLSALAQMAFILTSAGAVTAAAVIRLADQQPVRETTVGIGVMVASAVITLAVVAYQHRVVAETGSHAIAADRANFLGDVVVAIGIIGSLVAFEVTSARWLDPLAAIAVAGYLVRNAWRLWQDASDLLLDRELADSDRQRIKSLALAHTEARGVHDLRTRSAGTHCFVELHVELDGDLDLERAHDIVTEIENSIEAAYPGAEVLIHPEPAGIDDERLDHRIRRTRPALSSDEER